METSSWKMGELLLMINRFYKIIIKNNIYYILYNKHIMDKSRPAPQIFKVRDEVDDGAFEGLHPNIPAMPSLCLIIGSVRSGKCLFEYSLVQSYREHYIQIIREKFYQNILIVRIIIMIVLLEIL
jgi:hypothetical protein